MAVKIFDPKFKRQVARVSEQRVMKEFVGDLVPGRRGRGVVVNSRPRGFTLW